MSAKRLRAAALLGLMGAATTETLYRLMFIDTATGFLECLPPLRHLYYILMALSLLPAMVAALRLKPHSDPILGGGIMSQLFVMAAGISAILLGCKMAAEVLIVMKMPEIPLGSRVSRMIGLPLTLAGGTALAYAGYDYTSLRARQKKAGFALLGAAMQTYQLMYRFPELLEVTTAPAQTLELLFLLSAAPFMLFWARTLSGEATQNENRLTYLSAVPTALLGISYLSGEIIGRLMLSDVLPMSELPLLSSLLMLTVSLMALSFVLAAREHEGQDLGPLPQA